MVAALRTTARGVAKVARAAALTTCPLVANPRTAHATLRPPKTTHPSQIQTLPIGTPKPKGIEARGFNQIWEKNTFFEFPTII